MLSIATDIRRRVASFTPDLRRHATHHDHADRITVRGDGIGLGIGIDIGIDIGIGIGADCTTACTTRPRAYARRGACRSRITALFDGIGRGACSESMLTGGMSQ